MRSELAALLCVLLWAGAAGAQEELDEILGGFEDDPGFEAKEEDPHDDAARWWDLSGSYELSGTLNLRSHRSAAEGDSGRRTGYRGLQRLRNRLNLQLDLEPWADWKLRAEGWGFWDAAYLLKGRSDYTREVRNAYEFDAELGEAWLQGTLPGDVDLKLGRQVVIWGRSETLRVLDVINPLDNREPGRVDLEDLRRPTGMLRLDAFLAEWTLTGLVIPEIRFDANPVRGSDFFPSAVELRERQPSGFRDLELAAALTGTFSGWDISFHAARFWSDTPRLARSGVGLVHDRLWMVGAGGNLTAGSWLFKAELAWLSGLGFFATRDEKARGDALLGVEYYGWNETTVVVEILNRHLFDHERAMSRSPDFAAEDRQEIAFRVTRNLWNDTLHLTLLGVLLGWNAEDGSILRVDLAYDIRDALSAGVGLLLYQTGELPPLDRWGRNDRLFFNLKWSF
ncbi:MAG: hypothetical protein CL910_14400 [Deltaproteobacteria bacterium]|nr:hypothetical protein [Deltaproteobacteria bacterium]